MPKQPEPPPAPAPVPDLLSYPNLESLIEQATPAEVESFFEELKRGLAQLKGPKAEQAKKVTVAIQATDELFRLLLEVRAKLEADKGVAVKGRK